MKAQFGYQCEYCDGTVRAKQVDREAFKHKTGFVILEDVFHCSSHTQLTVQ